MAGSRATQSKTKAKAKSGRGPKCATQVISSDESDSDHNDVNVADDADSDADFEDERQPVKPRQVRSRRAATQPVSYAEVGSDDDVAAGEGCDAIRNGDASSNTDGGGEDSVEDISSDDTVTDLTATTPSKFKPKKATSKPKSKSAAIKEKRRPTAFAKQTKTPPKEVKPAALASVAAVSTPKSAPKKSKFKSNRTIYSSDDSSDVDTLSVAVASSGASITSMPNTSSSWSPKTKKKKATPEKGGRKMKQMILSSSVF
jgi:hypothetical protein